MIPSHFLTEIYLKLPYEEIVRHAVVCSQFNSVLNDPVFWKQLVIRDFGVSIASICNNPGWRNYYEICDGIEPCSVKNIRWWNEKNKWNVRRYNVVKFFMKTIKKSNFRRMELYFRYGCNDVVQDEEYKRILRWSYSEKRPRGDFKKWFWFLVQRIKFDNMTSWQDVAQDLLIEVIKNPCTISHNPNIYDVVKLIQMSKKQPFSFIYETLGCAKDIQYYLIFMEQFPEVFECEMIRQNHNLVRLKTDCYFFLEMGKNNNISLFNQYLELIQSQGRENLNIREFLYIVSGCVECDHLDFLKHISRVQSSMFTPERLFWVCGTIPYCPTRILDFVLCMALYLNKSDAFIRKEVDILMDTFLKFYCGEEFNATTKRLLEANISLLIGWGYRDCERIVQVTEGKLHYIGI